MPFLQFQINTPQSIGASIAIKQSRKAAKRKAAYPSDLEPSPKKQKSLPNSAPLDPAPSQNDGYAATLSGPTEEVATLADASPSPALTQTHNATDSSPAGEVTRKRKLDNVSIDLVQGIQDHNVTDLDPAPKKQKLSYATMHSAKPRKRLSYEDSRRVVAQKLRGRLEDWCRHHGYDYQSLHKLADDVLTHPDFRAAVRLDQTSANPSKVQGVPDPDLYSSDGPAVEKLISGTPRLETLGAPNQNIPGLPHNTATQAHAGSSGTSLHPTPAQRQISAERPDSGDENSHHNLIPKATAHGYLLVNGVLNRVISDQTSTSLSSSKSASGSPICDPSDLSPVYDTSNKSPVCDITNDTAARSDQTAPLSLNSNLRLSSKDATSSPTPSVGPPRNRGGRPKGRKPRPAKPFKTPKGPMRFQKNHPVKAAVNVDIWENILSFCPPDFLLKARTVSSTFRSVLKDDSPIWKISRVKHFGSDMPDPPSGLSEPQYADLLTGTGCQNRGCISKKTRKTYWAFQRRLCLDCFHQAFLPVSVSIIV